MASRRARLGSGHALAWVAYGLVAGALMTDAVGRAGAPVSLALGAVCALAAAALGLLAAARVAPRTLLIVASALAAAAATGGGMLALIGQPPSLLVGAALGLAAGAHIGAIRAEAGIDAGLAPRVRPAPTLLVAAIGVALAAAAAMLPGLGGDMALIAAALLQLVVIGLAIAAGGTDPGAGSERDAPARIAPTRMPPPLLALLLVAAAGGAALAALRPVMSAIGTDDPQPAGPVALTLALGGLLGPPLAVLAERLGASGAAMLATVGGGLALAAPIARPGFFDWVAAGLLGVALAASVALVEVARRGGGRLPRGAVVLAMLAGAAGAGIAAMLLGAVPVADVTLGAALACLVAAIGIWVPRASEG